MEIGCPRLNGILFDLPHTVDVDLRRKDRGKILQRARHRIVQPRHHEQIHEKRHNRQLAFYQERASDKRRRGDPQLQQHACRNDKHCGTELAFDRASLHRPDFAVESSKISAFRIVGFEVAHRFKAFLNAVGKRHLGFHLLSRKIVLHLLGKGDDGKRHGKHPKRGKRHPIIVEEHADRDQHGGKNRAEELGNPVRERRFKRRTVRHQRACQIGKVFFAEKGKRELTELFRERHAAHGALLIGRKIGRIVLPPCGQENQYKRRRDPHAVNPVVRFRHAAAVKIIYQQIQKTDGKHQNDV